jgi:hypothetical protein
MNSLQIASIDIAALLKVSKYGLPIEIPREVLCHFLDEFNLAIEIIL